MNDAGLEQNTSNEETSKNEKTAYKSFESREEFENFLNETKAKIAPEIKKQIEKEAKMTAEQRLQERIDELEKEKSELAAAKNRAKAERLFVSKGISEKEYDKLLDFLVDANEEATLDRTNRLLSFVESTAKIIADEKIKRTMKQVETPKTETGSESSDNAKFAKFLGKIRAGCEKTALETVNKYK